MTRSMWIAFFAPEEPTPSSRDCSGRLLPALAHDDLTMVISSAPCTRGRRSRAKLAASRAPSGGVSSRSSPRTYSPALATGPDRCWLAPVGCFHSVAGAARCPSGSDSSRPGDINEPSFVGRIAALQPDLLVSPSRVRSLRARAAGRSPLDRLPQPAQRPPAPVPRCVADLLGDGERRGRDRRDLVRDDRRASTTARPCRSAGPRSTLARRSVR